MTSPLTAVGGTPFTAPLATPLPKEATYQGDIARGSPTARVRLVQEWLSLYGIRTSVDGDYGGATSAAVKLFQTRNVLPVTGIVDRATFDRLVAPMLAALHTIAPPPGATLGAMTVAYARQHLAQKPREVGGENMGPWVRLYMDGNQGAEWLWCSGFATFCQRQAATTLGVQVPVARTFSCDDMARGAKRAACFVAGCPDFRAITPGSLFLVRKTADDWQHIGIVTSAERDAFHTIEGNTNDDGSREGYEVCERVRAYDGKDFVVVH
ncbi:Peptidoglycan-binding domain 1 protein [Gemmatirosa kalamazoonensis]|uniref:Peptidoglycan-binding domain 1 protein n=1 Tax=Gemmatirosa kalamazoonensis TaxID=861299 RepID=W0RL00_9BACT|nr:peptidoglycan-binding protein [Gemmatirosa kalamazoonensis]AHG90113.1 Peptidoglycan-binding domain 1 protein [Gemmatirosa kalamazoonensis]